MANYQAALRSVTFSTTTTNLSTGHSRGVSFLVNDGTSASNSASRAINLLSITATTLVVSTQPPANIAAGTGFGLVVTAEDAQGDVAATFNGTVTVVLTNNPGSSTLGGVLTATATSGVATF